MSTVSAEPSLGVQWLRGAGEVVVALARMVLSIALILGEPLLRVTLVPLAFGAFFVAIVLGALLKLPGIPIGGLLGVSVVSLLAYFLWWRLIHLLMPGSGPRGR